MIKKEIAFSLVELMISLIVISIVTAAFAPVITKKLKVEDRSLWAKSTVDYIYDEEICTKKVENCAMCLADTCIRCKNNYYLKNNSCIECSKGCVNCDITQGCTRCETGYYLDNGICTMCPEGCAKCDSATSCSECKQGYYINGSNCTECDSNCVSCSNTQGCLWCLEGYEIKNKQCSKLECPDSQHISGNKCAPCDRSGVFTCNEYGQPTGCRLSYLSVWTGNYYGAYPRTGYGMTPACCYDSSFADLYVRAQRGDNVTWEYGKCHMFR